MSDNCVVKVTIITNTFEPSNNPINESIPFIHGVSLSGYLGDLKGEYVVALNGGLVEAKDYQSIYLSKGDHLIVSPIPQGGGGGKNILRIIAVVALSYFTLGAGGMAGAGFMGMTGAAGYAAAGAAFIGGTMLINSILPPALPGTPNSPKSYKDSPTYGIDGAKNTSNEGIPIPLVYGKYRMAGNIISMSSENLNNTQYLYMLINAGEGEIGGISEVLVNDQPISNFQEIDTQFRFGKPKQPIIDWFGETVKPSSVGTTIYEKWFRYTTKDEVDKLRIDFVFPRGLQRIDKKSGNRYEESVDFFLQYRHYSESNVDDSFGWIDLPWINASGSPQTGKYTISGKSQTPLRHSVKSALLAEGRYEIRIRRTNEESESSYIVDSVTVSDVNEILIDKIAYNYTALMALRVKLTNQLNNRPKVTFLNHGLVINTWDESKRKWVREASNNPAWIAYDLLTNERYGAGISPDQIKVEKFKDWAKWCAQQKLTFNGIIDVESNVFDTLQPIFRLGHAKIISVGTRISVSVEKPDTPVMMFGSSNIIADSFSIDWLSSEDRANEIEITYFDEKSGNKQTALKVYDDESLKRGDKQCPSSMTLIGCATEEQAFYEGQLALAVNKYINQTVSFDAALEAIACTIGSVVYVQHDMPQWGYSGRIRSYYVDKQKQHRIKLDYDIKQAMNGNEPDTILLHSSANKRFQGLVAHSSNNVVRVKGWDAEHEVTRAIINGVDMPILSVAKRSGYVEIVLDTADYISPNHQIELWDTDLIEERHVIVVEGDEVVIDRPFSFTPTPLMSFMTGTLDRMKKKFRITGIDYNTEHTRTIRAIEYNASIYDRNIPFEPSLNASDIGLLQETELSDVSETLIRIGDNLRPKVKLSYSNSSSIYKTTEIYISKDGGEYELIGTDPYSISFESEDNAKLKIKLVAMDSVGATMGINGVKTHEYTVLGKTAPPSDVTNLELQKEVGGIKLTWDANGELDLAGYDIRQGTSWESAVKLSEKYGGTMLFVPIKEPGEYTFMIRAVDTSGNKSTNVAHVTIGLERPDRVINFITIQHSDKICFQWDRPKDRTISKFYIREGKSWQSSLLVAEATGTDFTLPVNLSGDRTFWIKAIDIIGLESEDAVYSTTNIARLEDRNMVYRVVHGRTTKLDDPRPSDAERNGVRYINCLSLSGAITGEIEMIENVTFSEYISPIILPYKARARNAIGMTVGSLVKDSKTWIDADFAWNSEQANIPWAGLGDPEMISFKKFISIKNHSPTDANWLPQGSTYHFTLEKNSGDAGLTDTIHQFKPSSVRGLNYGQGKFGTGVHLTPFTRVNWNVNTTGDFSVTFWAMVGLDPKRESGFAWYAKTTNSTMYLYYDRKFGRIVLTEHGVKNLIIENFRPAPGDLGLIGISQKGTVRTLRVGLMDGRIVKQSIDIGKATSLKAIGIGSPA